MKNYFHKIHYFKRMKPLDWLVFIVLCFFSIFYTIIILFRQMLYSLHILKSTKLNAYVISVGNLTTGGTGKTPITCELANYINNNLNKKVAIISRGYGGQLSNKNTNIISDGENVFYDSLQAGDEPFWMAKNCKNTAVITGKNRVKSGKYSIDNFKSEVLLLDDGFQHLKLKRNLDIILIDGVNGFGNMCLLPAGPLREGPYYINRADKVIIVNKNPYDADSQLRCEAISENISKKYKKETFLCNIKPEIIYDLKTKEEINTGKALAFAGIGQPEFFFNSLKKQNIELISEKIFTDHYLYTKLDIENIMEEALKKGADSIITTEKDAVKLIPFLDQINLNIRICALKLGVELDLEKLLEDLK